MFVSKAASGIPQVWKRALRSYEELRDTIRGDCIPLYEALEFLYGLVEEFDVPTE